MPFFLEICQIFSFLSWKNYLRIWRAYCAIWVFLVFSKVFRQISFQFRGHLIWLIHMDITSVRMINFDINKHEEIGITHWIGNCILLYTQIQSGCITLQLWTTNEHSCKTLFPCKLDVAIGYRSLKLPSQPFWAWGSLDTQEVISTSNPPCKVSAKFTA